MGSQLDERVSGHYGWSGLMEAIADEIRGKGIDPERVTVAQLAPVDNYHWHRLAGTLALAHVADITAADHLLDVGGGIGGPARFLISPEETRGLIIRAGFRESRWLVGGELEAELERPDPLAEDAGPQAELDPGLLDGPHGPVMAKNVGRNSREGRIVPVIGVFERL